MLIHPSHYRFKIHILHIKEGWVDKPGRYHILRGGEGRTGACNLCRHNEQVIVSEKILWYSMYPEKQHT